MKLITMAAMKAEYLAKGPKFSTACDSNSPGVSENKVWDAISGRKGPPASDLISSEIPIASAPATIPAIKDFLNLVTFFDCHIYFFNVNDLRFFPHLIFL